LSEVAVPAIARFQPQGGFSPKGTAEPNLGNIEGNWAPDTNEQATLQEGFNLANNWIDRRNTVALSRAMNSSDRGGYKIFYKANSKS